jgi:amino acid permease
MATIHSLLALLVVALLATTSTHLVPTSLAWATTTPSPLQSWTSPTALVAARGGGAGFRKRPVGNNKAVFKKVAAATIDSGDHGEDGEGTATIPSEVFNLVKSIAGAGLLSLPYGVAAFGNAPSALIPALSLIGVMGILSGYTFQLIARTCRLTNTKSYAAAWDATVGPKSAPLIAFSCFIDCFAGNLSYSMILADTMMNLLALAGIVVTRTQSLLSVTAAVLLPLCLMKNLNSLAPFSLVGITGVLYTAAIMVLRYVQGAYAVDGAYYATQLATPVFGTAGAAAFASPQSLILACMLSNAYIAHFLAPTLLTELKNNTMKRFNQVIVSSFTIVMTLYAVVTAAGFLTFGSVSNGLILNNYAASDILMSIARIAVAISITCSYPLLFVGTRDGLLDLFNVKEETRNSRPFQIRMTLGILGIITAAASQLTDLGLVASVGGATFGTALVFVYPVIMFLKSQQKSGKRTLETIPVSLIGVLGVVMGIIGTRLSLSGAEL